MDLIDESHGHDGHEGISYVLQVCSVMFSTALRRRTTVVCQQDAVVVIKDVFRKYPNRYEGIIVSLCSKLEELDESEVCVGSHACR